MGIGPRGERKPEVVQEPSSSRRHVEHDGLQFEILGINALDEFTMATPAIARNSIVIRTLSKLYRITFESNIEDKERLIR